jgi:sugar lactone lactonase YvrE
VHLERKVGRALKFKRNSKLKFTDRWSGSRIVRFNREGTEIIFEIHFPRVYSVTACCFGGPDNDQMFVTTAHPSAAKVPNSDTVFEQYPDSGHLYQIDFKNRFRGGSWRHVFGG